jgi:hypothetical protein
MSKIFREDDLKDIPALYAQDGKGDKAVVHLVVQIPNTGFVWLITEFSEEEELFFGFACLNDVECAELGYISKIELEDLAKQYPLKIEAVDISLKEAKEKYIKE